MMESMGFKGVYSHPSKNEGWGTLFPVWDREVKGWPPALEYAHQTGYFRRLGSLVPCILSFRA